MSIARVALLPMLMVACAHEASPVTPRPATAPMKTAPTAAVDDTSPAPLRLSATPSSELARWDVDAGTFVAPAGAFGVIRDASGEQTSRTLSNSVLACAKDAGSVYVRVTLIPEAKVAETDAKPAVAQCVLAQLARDSTWRTSGTTQIEVVLRRP